MTKNQFILELTKKFKTESTPYEDAVAYNNAIIEAIALAHQLDKTLEKSTDLHDKIKQKLDSDLGSNLSDEQVDSIIDYLSGDKFLLAVKALKDFTGCGLKDAKDTLYRVKYFYF